jgi:hypothetical protein
MIVLTDPLLDFATRSSNAGNATEARNSRENLSRHRLGGGGRRKKHKKEDEEKLTQSRKG